MSEMQAATGKVTLSTRILAPSVQRIGARDIETTFLGNDTYGQPTWVLWSAETPYLIGMLKQADIGFTFEQRTDQGVLIHENISFRRLQRAIGG